MRSEKQQTYTELIMYTLLFVGMCVFFNFVPYTDDDLRWGCSTGLYRLKNGFAGYGGRYIGYLIVIGLTRSTFFKVIFMSAIVTLMCYLIRYITKLQVAPYVVVLSIMLAPLSLFRSTIGWVSGFANYVTSICFTLIYIAYIVRFEQKNKKKHSISMTIILCLLGVVNTLIVEHFTIYNVLLGILVAAFFTIKEKRIFIQLIAYIVGCCTGAILMFSNSAYHNVLTGDDSYRDVGNDGIIDTMASGLAKICRVGYMDNVILNTAILVALCFVISRYKSCLSDSKYTVVKGCLFVNFGYIIASCFMTNLFDETGSASTEIHLVVIFTSLLSILALMIIAILFAKQYVCFRNILFLLISIVVIDAPFLVVNPITPRVFFGTYILFTILFCILLKQLCQEIKILSEKNVKKVSKVGLWIGAVFYIAIFSSIYKADYERLQNIRQQVSEGKKTVVMRPIPYEQFVHEITLYKKWELEGYKKFYHLPKDLKIVVEEKSE